MITCNLKGGLGNQLFQIFATIAYSIEHNCVFKFLYTDTLGGNGSTKRCTYWETFLKQLKPFTLLYMPASMTTISEKEFLYNPLPKPESKTSNIILNGYFQSYKYFEKYYAQICRFIKLTEHQTKSKSKYQNIQHGISIHFRLGDYKNLTYFHPIMTLEYYSTALQHIIDSTENTSYTVWWFCESEDGDSVMENIIQPLQVKFPNCIFKRVEDTIEDWEQLIMMSCCKHNIIANSSFSWFAAYFNDNGEKIVCYPEKWFCGHGENIVVDDLFPKTWSKIQ